VVRSRIGETLYKTRTAASAAPLLLLRHATAGYRREWRGDDRLRPLDVRGRRQAEELVRALAAYDVTRILTSPFARCVQTVEPIAAARGLEIEETLALAEPPGPWARSLVEAVGPGALLCTHGDVITEILGGEVAYDKGSTWVLDAARPDRAPIRYLEPPA
jgi:8-oxo-dGTP diphosphatase